MFIRRCRNAAGDTPPYSTVLLLVQGRHVRVAEIDSRTESPGERGRDQKSRGGKKIKKSES